MDEQKPNPENVEPSTEKPALTDEQIRQQLIYVMKKRDAEEETRSVERKRRFDFESRKIHQKMAIELLKVQFNCSHRKGTFSIMTPTTDGFYQSETNPDARDEKYLHFLPKLPRFEFDFAVIKHGFVDGTEMIRCMLCNRTWRTGDPDFAEANKMVLNSTNKPSSSERILLPLPNTPQGIPEPVAAMIHKGFWRRFLDAVKARFLRREEEDQT